MSGSTGRTRVSVLLTLVVVGIAACGGSSNSSSAYTAPSAASSGSSSNSGSGGGGAPMTKAKLAAITAPVLSAQAPVTAAIQNNDPQALTTAIAAEIPVLQTYVTNFSALKAPSAQAATLQQQFASLVTKEIVILGQVSKAVSANDQTAAKAANALLVANIAQQKQIGPQLKALVP